MTSSGDDIADGAAKALFVMFTDITDHMMTLRGTLDSNPATGAVTRTCMVRRYGISMAEGELYCFESYVEAETHTGEIFCWSLEIALTPTGWTIEREVSTQVKGEQETIIEFECPTFRTFDELASNYLAMTRELVESANNFDFDR